MTEEAHLTDDLSKLKFLNRATSMKLSLCLFSYNHSKFIHEALQSVLAQDYSHLQIVIVDDGSDDNTQEIILSEISKYNGPHEIKLHLKECNKGLADSVNTAIYDLADGEWLVFAAGDDISKHNRCSKIAKFLIDRDHITSIQSGAEIVDENLNVIGKRRPRHNTVNDLHRLTVCGAAASYKREAVIAFPRFGQMVRNEDFVLTGRAILKGVQGELESESVLWRRHGDNLTAKLSESGKEFGSVSFSLLQQISDVGYLATRNEIDEQTAITAIRRLNQRISRIKEKVNFYTAKTSLPSFLRYILFSPVLSLREFALIFYSNTISISQSICKK